MGGSVRVLVTGGARFIGSHLCDNFIAKGDEVNVVDDLSAGRAGRPSKGVGGSGRQLDRDWGARSSFACRRIGYI